MSEDNISFLVEHGMSLEEIQDTLARGISMKDIVESAQRMVDRGESLKTQSKPQKEPEKRVSIESVRTALQELGVTLRYNMLLREAEVDGLPVVYSKENSSNILPVYLSDYLRECGYTGVTPNVIEGCLNCIADQNRYNPIESYLTSGVWDGEDRFQEIYRILGVTSIRLQTYITKWFVQCVALGLNREDKPIGADGVLVLQGPQGLAKTSFFRIMAPFPRWFVEGAVVDMSSKDSLITALSGWITELGELDSTLKREQTSLKAFITRPEDRLRMPYAKRDSRTPRRTSFCGTVNPKDYLKDETGSRRFWTIPVTNIDKKALFSLPQGWVDQVWLQAYDMYKADHNFFRLNDDEIRELQIENQEFEAPLPYEIEIRALLNYSLPLSQWEWWRASEIAKYMPGNADARRVGKALARVVDGGFGGLDKPEKVTRVSRGNNEYFIPMKHFSKNMVGMVDIG